MSGLAAGTYILTARATDNLGAIKTSTAISFTVQAATGCTSPQYVENGGYVAGSKVQNAGSQYQCKPYPYTGWCNGASWAYAPGNRILLAGCMDIGWCLYIPARNGAGVVTTEAVLLTSAPNPFGNSATISVNVEEEGETSVIIYDQIGRVIEVLANGNYEAGTYSFNLDGNNLQPGMYVCRFVNNGKVISSVIAKQ